MGAYGGLGGHQYKTACGEKNDFFVPEIWAIPTFARRSRASIYSPSIRFAFMGAFQWRQISCPFFISTAGHRILSVFISTAEHRIARAILERARARAMNELLDWRLSFRFCFRVPKFVCQVKKNNTVLLIQYCSYHLPLKNSTILLLTQPTQK